MISAKAILSSLLTLGTLAGCANQTNMTATVPAMNLSKQTITDTIEFRRGLGGISFAASFNRVGDMLAVCGTQATIGNLRTPLATAVMNDTGVTMNGKLVLSDLAYFTKVQDPSALLTTKGNCRLSTATWAEFEDSAAVGLKSLGSGTYSL